MKRLFIVVCLLGLAWPCLADCSWAATGKSESILSRKNISKTFRDIRIGTQKVVRETIDVVTLKKLREKKSSTSLSEPKKPWLNNTSKNKKKTEKKSIWSSLLPSSKKKESKTVKTMKDFVGLKRPN